MEMQHNCLYEGAQRKALIEHARALRMNGYASEAHGVMERVRWSALKQYGYSETKDGTDAARAFECFRYERSK
jgi:hypothetical protein